MAMEPKPRSQMQYEKVATDDWTQGIIEEIERDEERTTGFKDKETGEDIVRDCVRFRFKLDGYSYPHRSSWMTFGYGEKFNLFKKYICALVEGAQPDLKFDLERLKGMKVKVMWANNGDFQNVELVRPVGKKIPVNGSPVEATPANTDDSIPF